MTFNSPDRLNAVSAAMREALHDYLDAVERRDDVRVIVLRGAGRGFCAGLDLKDRPAASQAPGQGAGYKMLTDQRRWSQLVVKLRRIPQPVVALGARFGRRARHVARARRRHPHRRRVGAVQCGVHPIGFGGGDCGSSYLLPRLVGSSVARELLMTGRFCDAERLAAHRPGQRGRPRRRAHRRRRGAGRRPALHRTHRVALDEGPAQRQRVRA